MKLKFTFLIGMIIMGCIFISPAYGQTGSVRGVVTDAETGEPVIGVSIGIAGTTLGDATENDGSFFINLIPPGDYNLVTSSVGYGSHITEINVVAGEVTTIKKSLKASSTQLGEVVVTGLRKSQVDAINQKRSAINTKEVLTTNDIGRLPDINVAEAAQRVSGVSIETDAGEGRFISIRGIQPSLNNVTMNNTNIGSTGGGRATPLDLLPVEMISSIEVTKANTPDMEGTAIGGAINIETISAFDKANSEFFIGSVDGLIQEQQADYGDNKLPYRAALTYGKRFGKGEKFGAVVSANFFRRDFSISVADPDQWQLLQGSTNDIPPNVEDFDEDGDRVVWEPGDPIREGAVLSPGYLGPNEIELQIEDNERDRYGITADLEYRPSVNSRYFFRTLYTGTDERTINSEFELTVEGVGNITNQTPTSGRFDAGSGELDLSSSDDRENLYSFSLGGENRLSSRISLDYYVAYSRADRNFFSIDGTFENPTEPIDTEPLLSSTYNTEPFFFIIEAEDLETARDPSLYTLRNLNFRRDNTTVENMYEADINLRYDLNVGNVPAYLKVGGRYRTRDIKVDRSRDEYNDDPEVGDKAENPYTLAEFAIDPFPPVQGGTAPNVHGDAEAFRAFFANPANLNNTERIFFRADDTADEIYDEDLNTRESVSAAYIMGVFDFNKLTITGGVRVEHTQTTASPWTETDSENANELGYEQLEFNNSYTNVMPSIHLMAHPAPNFITRLSWTNTIGRPDYSQLAGTSEFEVVEVAEGEFQGSFEGANADLKPLESMNLDLSLEYYFKSGGIATLGGFYKNIDNQIFGQRISERDVTFQGIFFETLNRRQDINLDAAQVYGIEASYDHAFTFLPGFLSGFGITANGALIESKSTFPGRENDNIPLFRQPSSVFNIIPYYQKYGLEFRLAVTYRSDFLIDPISLDDEGVPDDSDFRPAVAVGFSPTEFDRYEAERTVVDVTAAYTFPGRKIKILGQIRNLTNAPEWQYRGNTSRYDRHELFGTSYFLGVSFNL